MNKFLIVLCVVGMLSACTSWNFKPGDASMDDAPSVYVHSDAGVATN